jgi:hypothetical protein
MDPLGYIILAVILSMLGGYVNDTTNEEPDERTPNTD